MDNKENQYLLHREDMANLKMDGSFPEEKLNREEATKELGSVDWLPVDLELFEKIWY